MKMTGPMEVIMIHSDNDAVICVGKLYREAVAAFAGNSLALADKISGKQSKEQCATDAGKTSRKRVAECSTPGEVRLPDNHFCTSWPLWHVILY